MSPDELNFLASIPVIGVLIYLIIRMQAEKEKLITALVEGERAHARDLVEIITSGKWPVPDKIRAAVDCEESNK